MKLPFFNRQRYVLLKAYTPTEYISTYAPIALAKMSAPSFPDIDKKNAGFKTCYGHIASLKRSATVMAPCDIEVEATDDTWNYAWPGQEHLKVTDHSDDLQYRSKTMYVTKLELPWVITCNKPDVLFVMSSHILNDTETHIPSGLVSYKRVRACNIFNYIARKSYTYHIPFKKPLVSIYPLTDLPLHVECEYNPALYLDHKESASSKPKFKNSELYLRK